MKKVMYKNIDKSSLKYAEKNLRRKVTLMDYFIDTIFQKVDVKEFEVAPKKTVIFNVEENKKLKKVSNL